MDKPRISEIFENDDKWEHNPISGHSWRTIHRGKLLGYEVRGGNFAATKHRTLKQAQKEVEIREKLLERLQSMKSKL